jgi:hypothetical protein
MAFLKYARARVVKSSITMSDWEHEHELRQGQILPFNKQAGTKQSVDPKDVLLSHCTIIASVDTESAGETLGRQMVDGFQIDRRYDDYLITPETSVFVNNNQDSWERKLLLATFKTFIGGENYCFLPDTLVVMADGTQKAISQVVVGDDVLTHTGKSQKVTKTFVHQVDESICSLYFDRYKTPVKCTSNHPFRKLVLRVPESRRNANGKEASHERYRLDSIRRALQYGDGPFARNLLVAKGWVSAGDLAKNDFVCGPESDSQGSLGDPALATLLGYYLSEGCLSKRPNGSLTGIILSFGLHERDLVDHALELAGRLNARTRVSETQCSTFRVEILGPGIGDWFLKHGGEYSHAKRLSPEAMSWSKDSLLAVLAAWVSGDAQRHIKTERVVGSTASFDLSCQMARICDVTGVKASLWHEKEESFKKRQQNVSTVIMTVGGEPRSFEIRAEHSAHNVIISRGSFSKFQGLTPRWSQSVNRPTRKRDDAAWYQGTRIHQVSWVGEEQYTGPVFNFEVEGDNSYVLGLCGVAVHNCEHLQVPELSKGKIIDACARDTGNSIYVDILVATDRKHAALINAIQSGQLSTLSMGCSVLTTQCSKCGNVAEDETQLCKCVKYSKGNTFIDKLGKKRKIAELCGHWSDPKSVKFIEASWVANPAFTGAVLRSILTPEQVSSLGLGNRLQLAFNQAPRVIDANTMQRAASQNQFDFGGQGGDQGATQDAPKEEDKGPDPLEKAVGDVADFIRERAVGKVRQQLGEKETPRADLSDNLNNTLVKEAAQDPSWRRIAKIVQAEVGSENARRMLFGLLLYRKGGWKAVKSSNQFKGSGILALSRLLDLLGRVPKIAGETKLYRTVVAVGGAAVYGDVNSYLAACRRVLGRNLTGSEEDTLIVKGRLYDLGAS